jgi:hypothetical protein
LRILERESFPNPVCAARALPRSSGDREDPASGNVSNYTREQ